MRRWILGAGILILLAVIFFEPSYGWKLRAFLSPAQNSVGQADDASTAAENVSLKAQLAVLQKIADQIPSKQQNYIRAMVFSRYPLNFKNEILIDRGSNDGVAAGAAVLFQNLLIGRIVYVYHNESLVQTIFDSAFAMPVRVGPAGYDGLLKGGSYPMIVSINKNAAIGEADVMYAAAPGLPYGLPIGEIAATSTSLDSLFTEATVSFPYDINDIQAVLIDQGT